MSSAAGRQEDQVLERAKIIDGEMAEGHADEQVPLIQEAMAAGCAYRKD